MGKKRKRSDNSKPKSKSKPKIPKSLPNPTPNPNPQSSSSPWPELPEPLLHSILLHLSALDLLSAAAACRRFRLAVASLPHPRGPPLLLTPHLSLPQHRLHIPKFVSPARASLQTLTPKFFASPVSPQTLDRYCVGCSHANLILISSNRVLLADVFSGEETRSPYFPPETFRFSLAILTAPITSKPSCSLLMIVQTRISDDYFLLRWKPGTTGQWAELQLTNLPEILSLVVFKQRVYGLDSLYRLVAFEFEPQMSFRLLNAQLTTGQIIYNYGKFGPHLVERGNELLAVVFVSTGVICLPSDPRIEVYGLDELRGEWVKKEGLGDWCLFIDAVGKCSFACPEPGRWGGRKNCVYVAGPGFEGFSVFPLDGEAIDTCEESPLRAPYMRYPRWPSPVWVYPNMKL